MAEKYPFVIGSLGTDFLQLKTTDNIYLKDLLEETVFPSLELYNSEYDNLMKLLCYQYEDAQPNTKRLFSTDEFTRLGDLEQPGTRTSFESWNRPLPILRYGAGTKMTIEVIKQMSSKQIIEWHNAKMIADRKLLIKTLFQNAITKDPAEAVDELTSLSATPKAFWNDETGMDIPRANGQITFDGDHQHYLAVGTGGSLGSNGAELDTLIARITEHASTNGQILLFAKKAGTSLGLIKAESTNFRSINTLPKALLANIGLDYMESGVKPATIVDGVELSSGVKVVGAWKESLVVETPDMVDNYIFATVHISENNPDAPMALREHPQFKGLMLYSDTNSNPIIGKDAQYRRYLALNVWNRDAGAALITSATTWAEPTFN